MVSNEIHGHGKYCTGHEDRYIGWIGWRMRVRRFSLIFLAGGQFCDVRGPKAV